MSWDPQGKPDLLRKFEVVTTAYVAIISTSKQLAACFPVAAEKNGWMDFPVTAWNFLTMMKRNPKADLD